MSKILKNIYIDNKKYDIPDISGEVLTKDNTTEFTPTGDYNPATKKYVDDNVVQKSATAPSSPTEGMLWYDTTNDILKAYNGTQWNAVDTNTTYNAGPGIEIGTYNDYSAMQGPAPTGYHIPSKDEWVALCGILTSTFGMASNDTTMGTYLKMPRAGLRNRSSSGVAGQGSTGYYWSSTAYSSGRTYYLYITSSSLSPQEAGYRASGFSVRCFKDVPVIPDSSWTTLYQGTGSAGVFRNSLLGLISVSGDGTTWYTIQDKNLGATTVFNQGDTLTDANCGYFYQWGNNYGFPHSGTVTKSDTQVDASNYGPGNYYNSSTFITRSSGSFDWSSVQNDNLRGGVTGVVALNNAISNTGVLSVNGQTGAVTVNEGEVKVFEVPAVNDDISDMVTRLSAGKGVILHEMVSGTDAFYKVDYHDDVNCEITASLIYSYNGGYARFYTIVYNYSTKRVTTKTPSLTYFFAPETAGTQGQVLTKTNSGYEWANASGGFELAPNSPLTPKYRRYGSQAQYDALTQYYTDEPGDTVYFTI